MVRIKVRAKRPIRIFPGAYYKISTSEVTKNLITGRYTMAIWWDTNGHFSTDITFLLRLSQPETPRLDYITLDRPFGHDMELQNFEIVMLAAKGIGIAGVLPLALALSQRRQHNDTTKGKQRKEPDPNSSPFLHKNRTRKVNLFWKLNFNAQEKWIGSLLRNLQGMDPENLRCSNPSKEVRDSL